MWLFANATYAWYVVLECLMRIIGNLHVHNKTPQAATGAYRQKCNAAVDDDDDYDDCDDAADDDENGNKDRDVPRTASNTFCLYMCWNVSER